MGKRWFSKKSGGPGALGASVLLMAVMVTPSCKKEPVAKLAAQTNEAPVQKKVALKEGQGLLKIDAPEAFMALVDNQKMGLGKSLIAPVAAGLRQIAVFPQRHPPQFFEVDIKGGEEHTLSVTFDETPQARWKDANDPKKPLYWVLHAAASREKGKYAAAETLLRFALQSHPKDKRLWRQLAYTLPALKKKEAALNAMNRYLELAPNAPDKAHLVEVQKGLAAQMDDSPERREAVPVQGAPAP
ncbi:MAG: hypothetical protein CMH56_09575 [Myxococcales bacterium]|nr:hypothetical protein [Myxococcales bacterium]